MKLISEIHVKFNYLTPPAILRLLIIFLRTSMNKSLTREELIPTPVKQSNFPGSNSELTEEYILKESLKQELDLLKKEFNLTTEINNADSLESLKSIVCNQLFHHTSADEVWITKNISNRFEKIFYTNNSGLYKLGFKETDLLSRNNTDRFKALLKLTESINILNSTRLIKFDFFSKPDLIRQQIILTINIASGKNYHLGLNYFNKKEEIETDLELLRKIVPSLRPSFNRMETLDILSENEARYRSMIEKQNDVILIKNKYGKYIYVSPSIRKYGYNEEEILGKTTNDFAHKEDLPRVDEALNKILRHPEASEDLRDIRILMKNNQYGHAILTITNLLDKKGVEGIVINVHDITQKVVYETKIKRSETYFKSMFDNAKDAIVLIKDEKIIYCNNKTSELLKGTKQEITGRRISDFWPDKQKENTNFILAVKEIKDALNNEDNISFELVHQDLKGNEVDTHVTLNNLYFMDQNCVIARIRDISDIKHAYKSVEENELKLRTIFESMKDGVFLCSSDHSIHYLNNAMKEQIYRKEGNLSKCFDTVFGFDKPCSWCNKIKKDNKESRTDIIYNEKTGQHFQILRTQINMSGTWSTLHISRDITDIKKAQELVEQNEEKFRNIFNYSNDAIFITDTWGKYLEVNEIALSRAGYSKPEFLNMNIRNLDEYYQSNSLNDYFHELETKGIATTEVFYINLLGQKLYTEVNGRSIDYQGEKAFLHISRDISARKEVERKILETIIETEEKERTRFAQDLHDGIGPYLSATKLFLQSIARSEDTDARNNLINKAHFSLDEIIKNIKEISNNISPHVLRNFGLLSAMQSFKQKLNSNETKIFIVSNIEDQRFNENIEITCFRIILELINNTLKYSQASQIDIKINTRGTLLELDFSHNGQGFNFDKTFKFAKGQGLFNIINRVNSLKGKYNFKTSETGNFQFISWFPIN